MAIKLPDKIIKSKQASPNKLLLFGGAKVGKTTMLSQLDNCLIIDTEKGTDFVDALKVNIHNLEELREVVAELNKENPYDYIAIDTLDNIVNWCEQSICKEHNVTNIVDLAYGKGFGLVREKVMKIVNLFSSFKSKLILICHRKKTIFGNENGVEFKVSEIDISGKLKNMICADMDCIMYVYREDDKLLCSTETSNDELEVGSRIKYLSDKVFEFDWNFIYNLKK